MKEQIVTLQNRDPQNCNIMDIQNLVYTQLIKFYADIFVTNY